MLETTNYENVLPLFCFLIFVSLEQVDKNSCFIYILKTHNSCKCCWIITRWRFMFLFIVCGSVGSGCSSVPRQNHTSHECNPTQPKSFAYRSAHNLSMHCTHTQCKHTNFTITLCTCLNIHVYAGVLTYIYIRLFCRSVDRAWHSQRQGHVFNSRDCT